MTHVYVVIETVPQNMFCDGHGEIAADAENIIAIVRSEAKALDLVTELQAKDDKLIAEYDCDPSIFHYEKHEVN